MKNIFSVLVATILVVLCTACGSNNTDYYFILFVMFIVLAFFLALYLVFKTEIPKMTKNLTKMVKDIRMGKKEKDLQISLNNLKKENLNLSKSSQALHDENIDLGKQIDDKNQKIKELKDEIANKPTISPQNIAQPTEKYWQKKPYKGKYFFAELMLTAGPRKNFNTTIRDGDYDLGEDVAGFIVKDDKTFFWILDGTSDNDIITMQMDKKDFILQTDDQRKEEYFSSRWLAQSIGLELQQEIKIMDCDFNAKSILQKSFERVEEK